MTKIGIISDTHGLLRPEVGKVFAGCELIIHAGDIGTEAVLEELSRIAPVEAVRGNTDKAGWTEKIPWQKKVKIGGEEIKIVHDLADAAVPSGGIIVYGHSHQPGIEDKGGTLFINPGSAGPRRFDLPVTVALLEINAVRKAGIVHLLSR